MHADIVHTDGGLVHADGGLVHTDGGLVHADGGLVHTDGGLAHTDGGLMHTDGGLMHKRSESRARRLAQYTLRKTPCARQSAGRRRCAVAVPTIRLPGLDGDAESIDENIEKYFRIAQRADPALVSVPARAARLNASYGSQNSSSLAGGFFTR